MRSFAIEEPGSPVPALYATLVQRHYHYQHYIGSWAAIQTTNAIDYIQFPSLTAEWLEPLIPVCSKLLLAALFLQTTLWRGLAQSFDFCHFLVSVYPRRV